MADLSDITTYIENAATAAVYPNGTLQPSVAAMDVRIFEGWPLPDQLDLDMAGKTLVGIPPVPTARANGPLSNVSIFPMQGATATPYQILDNTIIISEPTFGISIISIINGVITASGSPNLGEYLTVIADKTYAYSHTGASTTAILAALAADFSANYPGVDSTPTTLTVPGTFSFIIRQGGIGQLGKVTHRQKQSIMISVWSPNHRARTTLAAAIDNLLKQRNVITLSDTSQAVITYNRTNVIDDHQVATIYRRDLIYDVEYATLFLFPGFVVTTVNTSVANYDNSAIAPAIT